MDKHSQITPSIYITNWIGSIDEKQLIDNEIKYILCLNCEYVKTENDLKMYKDYGIIHKYYKVEDHPDANIDFDELIKFIENEKKGNVLVHCTAGISRSTSAVIAYLMKKKKLKLSQALLIVKSNRTYTNPNYGFLRKLSFIT